MKDNQARYASGTVHLDLSRATNEPHAALPSKDAGTCRVCGKPITATRVPDFYHHVGPGGREEVKV